MSAYDLLLEKLDGIKEQVTTALIGKVPLPLGVLDPKEKKRLKKRYGAAWPYLAAGYRYPFAVSSTIVVPYAPWPPREILPWLPTFYDSVRKLRVHGFVDDEPYVAPLMFRYGPWIPRELVLSLEQLEEGLSKAARLLWHMGALPPSEFRTFSRKSNERKKMRRMLKLT